MLVESVMPGIEMLWEPPHHVLDVALSKNLIFRHRAGPTKQKLLQPRGRDRGQIRVSSQSRSVTPDATIFGG